MLRIEKITFDHIHTHGHVIVENDLYIHFHYPEMLVRYDSNFIEFKKMPSLEDFLNAANYLREFHVKNDQQHVKFTFPENEKLTNELVEYMKKDMYVIGIVELYAIEPSQFPNLENNSDIKIEVVTDENFEVFLSLQYEQDLEFGSVYANQKVELYKRSFQNPNIVQLIAYYEGTPAGSLAVNLSSETAEIDDLAVDEFYQYRGIGSRLQKWVMNSFPEKTVILVADGHDTPREMYRKQGYQYLGYQYNVQKNYEVINIFR